MKKYSVEFYEKDNGEIPARDFIISLDEKMRSRVYKYIDILSNNGPDLREPYSKMLSNGIFELRIKSGSDISRVLYFFYIGSRIILTNGFIKKTQKTPKSEIIKAKKYREDFIRKAENKI